MPPNYVRGDKKRCNGPLHNGAYIPLAQFAFFKNGKRKGKPFSRCKRCIAYYRFGSTAHGLVYYSSVKFVFEELATRIGKAETCRRLGVSQNFFVRRRNGENTKIRKGTVLRAMQILRECRSNDEAYHRNSIRHGSKIRGRTVKGVKKRYVGSKTGLSRTAS